MKKETCLREALARYISLEELQALAAKPRGDLYAAIHTQPETDEDCVILANLLDAMRTVLQPCPRTSITSPAHVAAMLMADMMTLQQEELRVVCLDTKNHIQAVETVYRGTLNATMCRGSEVLRRAIQLNSAAIILVHNHPSGNPTPSPEDAAMTEHVQAAAKLFDIQVLDHIVIGHGAWVSMREEGMMYG